MAAATWQDGNNQELNDFFLEVEEAIREIEILSEDMEGTLLLQAELILRDIVTVEGLMQLPGGEVIVQAIFDMVKAIRNHMDESYRQHIKGRPQIPISEEQLVTLLELHFSNVEIAKMLQVSPRTIRRRILQYGLQEDAEFSMLSDTDLDTITRRYVDTRPNSGERSLDGYLRGLGLKIQRSRVRDSLLRVDPRGVQTRFRQALHRRQYHVCMPNSLWHIDGHHKLIRWRVVIHGGIDGYSRLPVYLRASTNNLADTVLLCFLDAVRRNGLPSRVRCDRRGENVRVSEFMLNHPERGPGRRSCITGRSVHNQTV